VHPFEFKDEVFVHASCSQQARGLAGAANHAVFGSPGGGGAVDVDPAGEGLAVKEIAPAITCGGGEREARSEGD